MLIRAPRDAEEAPTWAATERGFAENFFRYRGAPLRLEPYQQEFLDDRSMWRFAVKSRQVGYSFLFAVEALARCHLKRNHTAIFTSYNQADAVEKVTVARELFEEMSGPFKKRLVVDSRTELVFESTGTGRRGRSRIVSVPSKAPRGKHGDVYLDELAHYQNARKVYAGTTATIMRSRGQLSVASTPLGRRGIFWEMASRDRGRFGHFTRQFIPWWACGFFCRDTRRAGREAATLGTTARVERFATEPLRAQLLSLELSHFQQELECSFVSDRGSFFPYALVLGCMSDDVLLAEDWGEVPRATGRLVAGYDVGRRRDLSEVALFEEMGERLVCRALRRFEKVPFAEQEAELRAMLHVLPIARLSIDSGGIGMNLAENLERDFPDVVVPETFSPTSKERWATDLKIRMQRRDVDLPLDRDLLAEIHSVQRNVTEAGRITFGVSSSADGHADRFWAIAMACQKERQDEGGELPTVVARVIGGNRPSLEHRLDKLIEWSRGGAGETAAEPVEGPLAPPAAVKRSAQRLPPAGAVRRGRPTDGRERRTR